VILSRCLCIFFLVLFWGVSSELLEAQLLRVGRELRGESMTAPGTKIYALDTEGMFPYEAVEVRISHSSLPPTKFTVSVRSFPDDGSVLIRKRTKRQFLRRRRRLNTEIVTLTTGKAGAILVEGVESQKTLLVVTAVPTGIKPGLGLEKQVDVRYNIIVERKIINNAIPETALKMIGFGIICLFVSSILIVPMLSATLRRGDDIIAKTKRTEDKRIS